MGFWEWLRGERSDIPTITTTAMTPEEWERVVASLPPDDESPPPMAFPERSSTDYRYVELSAAPAANVSLDWYFKHHQDWADIQDIDEC